MLKGQNISFIKYAPIQCPTSPVKGWTFNIWPKPNEDCSVLEKVLDYWLSLQILVSASEKGMLCSQRALCTVPSIPSGSWRCTCPWTGSLSCSTACSPSPGPWPARGRRGILCRQTSTRRQTVSQAQLGQNCSGDTGDKGLTSQQQAETFNPHTLTSQGGHPGGWCWWDK